MKENVEDRKRGEGDLKKKKEPDVGAQRGKVRQCYRDGQCGVSDLETGWFAKAEGMSVEAENRQRELPGVSSPGQGK